MFDNVQDPRERNYARNIRTRELVFFSMGDIPDDILVHPADWAVWRKLIANAKTHLIGETGSDYCERLAHVPHHKACRKCNPLWQGAVEAQKVKQDA